MGEQTRNIIFFCLTISIIAICTAQQESKEFSRSTSDEDKLQKQEESIEVLMKQVGDMGMLLENYRRVIVDAIEGSNDICGFIDGLSESDNALESN